VEIKALYSHASIVGDNRVVFNIGGNKYRLVVKVHYDAGRLFIRWVGTHEDYDKIDVEEV
jgi:mRNA interferase HigB